MMLVVNDYSDVQYDRLIHLIYLTSDRPICYTCNKVGHTKRTCESNNTISETTENNGSKPDDFKTQHHGNTSTEKSLYIKEI